MFAAAILPSRESLNLQIEIVPEIYIICDAVLMKKKKTSDYSMTNLHHKLSFFECGILKIT